jgi:predicted negative regulator of RcsB-dependent stress response
MAIDDLLDEHEQSERVRSWLRSNAAGLIGGVALGLGIIFGWHWWQQREQAGQAAAGQQYEAAIAAVEAKDLAKAQAAVAGLGEGLFAGLARLELAKAQADAGQRDAAIATLRAIKVDDPAFAAVVHARLARLLIEAGQAEDALKLTGNTSEGATLLEVRGDALTALGRRDEARAAYEQALTRLDVAAPQRRLIELKLAEVGGIPPHSEDKI